MTVIIHTDSHCALTSPSITCMTSLTKILLLNFIFDVVFAFPLKSNSKDDFKVIGNL